MPESKVATEMNPLAQLSAEEQSRITIAKEQTEINHHAAGKTKSEDEAKRHAEAKAAEQARLKAVATYRAAKRARTAAQERSLAENGTRPEAEPETKLQEAEIAKVNSDEESKRRADAVANTAQQARLRRIAETKAKAQLKLRLAAEAKAAEQARLGGAGEATVAQDAMAAQISRIAAENDARALAEALAYAEGKARAEKEARTIADAKRNAKKAAKAKKVIAKEERRAADLIASPKIQSAGEISAQTPHGLAVFSKKIWFYTCEGDRLGPVSFEELRTMVANGALHPRLDRVWKKGMTDWEAAGEIAGLCERRTTVNQQNAPLQTSYRPSQTGILTLTENDAPWPGINRRNLLLATLGFLFLWRFSLRVASPFLVQHFGNIHIAEIWQTAAFVPMALLAYCGLQRLVNLGMCKWWFLVSFVPILNLWLAYRCCACPPGYALNKKIDNVGIIIAILYWLITSAGVFILTSAIVLHLGLIHDTEFAQYLQAVIHSVKALGDRL